MPTVTEGERERKGEGGREGGRERERERDREIRGEERGEGRNAQVKDAVSAVSSPSINA